MAPVFGVVAIAIGVWSLATGRLIYGTEAEDRVLTGDRARWASVVVIATGVTFFFSYRAGFFLMAVSLILPWLLAKKGDREE